MDNNLAIRAEQGLLGALLLDNSAWDRVADLVSAGDFAQAAHRAIWDVVSDAASAGNAFDPYLIAAELERRNQLDVLPGGLSYVGNLLSTTASAAGITRYAERVREQSVLRQLVAVCSRISEAAQSGEGQPSEILGLAAEQIGAIADQSQRGRGAVSMTAAMRDAFEHLQAVYEAGGKLLGVPTGFADLDARLSGLQPGDLVILAGRPSMGKTALATNIAEHVAISERRTVAFFSLEMPSRQIALRVLASQSRTDFGRLRHADLDGGGGWERLTGTTSRINGAPLHIDDASGLTVGDISARARRLHRELGGLSLIVVDYLQLIATHGRVENRTAEVTKISQGLKALAKSLSVPVIALSQLNRGCEQRADKRPLMSDLRDSGGIEQDADVVALIYRDEVYRDDSPDKGTAEVIIAKQRQGEIGTVRLAFNGRFCRFDDLSRDWSPSQPEPRTRGRREYDY